MKTVYVEMIDIVIPHFKREDQLAKCRKAISEQHTGHNFGYNFIVENDSETGFGFTKNVNNGLKHSRNKYAVILNQDCYLKLDAMANMVSFMEDHPRCAIAGIKQLSSQNEDQIIHGGTLECFPAGRHEGGLVSKGDCAVSKRVPWVNGACMIVRKEARIEFGLMDETMKMFASDADWSFTARARGWETWYIADAVCVHEQGASKSMDAKMTKTFEKDMLAFRSKWIDGDLYRDLDMEVFTEDVCNADS